MNFLSHYYFHNNPEDNYFTVGLTLPDILQFQMKRIRLTRKILAEMKEKCCDKSLVSLINGMSMHLTVDSWFHSNQFFREKVKFLEDEFINYNSTGSKLPHFFAHILLEIYIDRYLLIIENDIADRFYDSYKRFEFKEVLKLFPEKDDGRFIEFAEGVAGSSFLKEYRDDKAVINAIQRVCKRIDIPFNLETVDSKLEKFISTSYSLLENDIISFVINTREIFSALKN